MTVPPETEDAAREVAGLYELTEKEVDVLASDHRFAVLAYLRRESAEWIEPLGYPITGGEVRFEDGELVAEAVETVDGVETDYARAVLFAWFGFNAYVEATEAIAEDILGRPIEERELLHELLRGAIEERGGVF